MVYQDPFFFQNKNRVDGDLGVNGHHVQVPVSELRLVIGFVIHHLQDMAPSFAKLVVILVA